MIEIKNISKWYGPVQVLNHCNTVITKGDVVVPASQDAAGEAATVRLKRDRMARAEQIERDAQITLQDGRMIDARFFAEVELVPGIISL